MDSNATGPSNHNPNPADASEPFDAYAARLEEMAALALALREANRRIPAGLAIDVVSYDSCEAIVWTCHGRDGDAGIPYYSDDPRREEAEPVVVIARKRGLDWTHAIDLALDYLGAPRMSWDWSRQCDREMSARAKMLARARRAARE